MLYEEKIRACLDETQYQAPRPGSASGLGMMHVPYKFLGRQPKHTLRMPQALTSQISSNICANFGRTERARMGGIKKDMS